MSGLSLGFPIKVNPSRLTFCRAGVFSEWIMWQSTNRVTECLLTSSRMLCQRSLKRESVWLNISVCLPVFSTVKANSTDFVSPLSLTASCSSPFALCICQIFQFLLTVLPLMRSTATNANSSGSPRGYADLKHKWKKSFIKPTFTHTFIYDHYLMSDDYGKKIAFDVQHHGQGSGVPHMWPLDVAVGSRVRPAVPGLSPCVDSEVERWSYLIGNLVARWSVHLFNTSSSC